jgi:hypothetical protein
VFTFLFAYLLSCLPCLFILLIRNAREEKKGGDDGRKMERMKGSEGRVGQTWGEGLR